MINPENGIAMRELIKSIERWVLSPGRFHVGSLPGRLEFACSLEKYLRESGGRSLVQGNNHLGEGYTNKTCSLREMGTARQLKTHH